MSAVKRHVFNVLAAVSLVLCVGTVVMWVLGYASNQFIYYVNDAGSRRCYIEVSNGDIAFQSMAERMGAAAGFAYIYAGSRTDMRGDFDNKRAGWRIGGFAVASIPDPRGTWFWLMMPAWFVALVLAAPSAIWLVRSKRMHVAGFCRKCGYDMRATPDRCPECGTAVRPAA
jgi:hypothetical protein